MEIVNEDGGPVLAPDPPSESVDLMTPVEGGTDPPPDGESGTDKSASEERYDHDPADIEELRKACGLPHMKECERAGVTEGTAPPSSWDSVVLRQGHEDNFEPMNIQKDSSSENDPEPASSSDESGSELVSKAPHADKPVSSDNADKCYDEDVVPFPLPTRRSVRTRTGRACRPPAWFSDFVQQLRLCPPV